MTAHLYHRYAEPPPPRLFINNFHTADPRQDRSNLRFCHGNRCPEEADDVNNGGGGTQITPLDNSPWRSQEFAELLVAMHQISIGDANVF